MPFSCFFNVWFAWGANTMWMSCPWFVFLDASELNVQAKQRAAPHKGGWMWDHTNLSICLTFEDSHLRTLWLYDIWISRILAQGIRNDRHWCFSVGRLMVFSDFPENFSLRPGNVTSQAGGVDEVPCVWLEAVKTKSYIILKYFETYILNYIFWMLLLRPAVTNAITTKTAALNGSKSNVKLFDKVSFA